MINTVRRSKIFTMGILLCLTMIHCGDDVASGPGTPDKGVAKDGPKKLSDAKTGDGQPSDAALPADAKGQDAKKTDAKKTDAKKTDAKKPADGKLPDAKTADGKLPDSKTTDGPLPTGCTCALNQVCTTAGACITPPIPGADDALGEFVLLHQVRAQDTSIIGSLGKGEVMLIKQEPLPPDPRQTYTTAEGETCWFEIGTMYPSDLGLDSNGDPIYWPMGPGLGAGDLTFKITGSGSDVVLEAFDLGGSWAYFHEDIPPALEEGYTSYPDFFDPVYLPGGAAYALQLAGGSDIDAQTLSGGEIPLDFTITGPTVEEPTAPQVSSGVALTVTWSPPQPSAFMEIFVTTMLGYDIQLLTCKVKDDGSTVIPATAMANFAYMSDSGLQLRRNVVRYLKAQTKAGKDFHAYLVGRKARVGSLDIQ